MKSLGNYYVLNARQLPFHLFVEGWPGIHIGLGQGTGNCMGFSIPVLEDVDCLSFPEVAARSITQSGQSGVDLLAAENRLLNVLMGLQSNGMSCQKRISQELFNAKTPPLPQKDSDLMDYCCQGFVFVPVRCWLGRRCCPNGPLL